MEQPTSGQISEAEFAELREKEELVKQKVREALLLKQALTSGSLTFGGLEYKPPTTLEVVEKNIASLSEALKQAIRLRDALKTNPELDDLFRMARQLGL